MSASNSSLDDFVREIFRSLITDELDLLAKRFRASMESSLAAAIKQAWQDAHLCDSSAQAAPPDVLGPVAALQRLHAPNTGGGVYFLVANGSIVYVGQSVNVLSRVGSHMESKIFDQVFYLPLPEAEYDAVESAFIRWLRPPLNGNPGPNVDPREAQAALARLGVKVTMDELAAGRIEVSGRQRRTPRPRQSRERLVMPTMPRTKPLTRAGGVAP